MPGAVLLGALDSLPVDPDLVDVPDRDVPEDVRMTPHQFVGEPLADGVEVEYTAFPGQLGVKDDLKQQVAQFLRQFVIIPGLDGVEEFVDFLDGMPAQGLVILLAVPGAALRGAERRHDLEHLADGWEAFGRGFHGRFGSEEDQVVAVDRFGAGPGREFG